MAFNPQQAFTMLNSLRKLKNNHPKAAAFARNVLASDIPEGTVIEVRVTKPGQTPQVMNMKIQADDLDALSNLRKSRRS